MRFNYWREGDVRRRKGLLLCWRKCQGVTRWLEYAEWEEQHNGWDWTVTEWLDIKVSEK